MVGREGFYEVSDEGRVRGLPRRVRFGRGFRDAPGGILSPSGKRGWPTVNLSRPGERPVTRTVYTLVLEAFVGPCPPGLECCHRDGDSRNNRLDNIRWDTHQANMDDQTRHGTRPLGSARPNAKVTEDLVRQIRALAPAHSQTALGERFGLSQPVISRIINRRIWRHVE